MNIEAKIGQIKGQIEEIKSLLINRGSKYTNSKPRTKVKRTFNIEVELILKIKIVIKDLNE